MSVLIKGMEIPTCCQECPFNYNAICQVAPKTPRPTVEFNKRRKDCPLVPVPPHGRLIDAEIIYDAVERRYRMSSGIEHRCERDLLDLICSAPTIPAEEGE